MFHLSANLAVYLHRGTIDFRKRINGLSAMVEHELRLDPFAHAAYVFGNRRCSANVRACVCPSASIL